MTIHVEIITALMTLCGVVGTAGIGWLTAAQIRQARALTHLEAQNRALWRYTRTLIDAHYRGGLGDPPPPPAEIAHIYQAGE